MNRFRLFIVSPTPYYCFCYIARFIVLIATLHTLTCPSKEEALLFVPVIQQYE